MVPMALYGDSSSAGIAQRLHLLWQTRYAGTKQGEFAEIIGVSPQALSNYFAATVHQRRMSIDTAITIVFRTQVTLDWLYLGNPAGLPLDLANTITRPPGPAAAKKPR